MKILTNKEYENRLRWARENVNSEYKYKALTLNYISSLFGVDDLSKMSTEELKQFFKFNPNTQFIQFSRGMKAGIDSIIDTLEKCGLARKHTLEKLRFRANKNIDEYLKKYTEIDDE